MLKTPRQAPEGRPAMSKPTTYNSSPVKSGEVTETRQAIKRGLRKYHSHQRRQPQTPTTTGNPPPSFPARACPRPTAQALEAGERPRQQRQSSTRRKAPKPCGSANAALSHPPTYGLPHPSHRPKRPPTPGLVPDLPCYPEHFSGTGVLTRVVLSPELTIWRSTPGYACNPALFNGCRLTLIPE
jgi:hypothetical protein